MTIATSTLRPGFLVSLKTTLRGGVHYVRRDLTAGEQEAEAAAAATGERTKWETERTINDPKEYKAGRAARSKAAGIIRSVCSQSAFGLLCPEVDSDKLEKAVTAARKVVDDFNTSSSLSTISIFVLTGRVMPDDVEAVRAINSEIRELMAEMATGIEGKNVEAIREAASRVKGIGEMLSADAQAKVQMAVETARSTAKSIVKNGAGADVDVSAVRRIKDLSKSFLDLDDAGEIGAPKAAAPAIDMLPSGAPAPKPGVRADLEG